MAGGHYFPPVEFSFSTFWNEFYKVYYCLLWSWSIPEGAFGPWLSLEMSLGVVSRVLTKVKGEKGKGVVEKSNLARRIVCSMYY